MRNKQLARSVADLVTMGQYVVDAAERRSTFDNDGQLDLVDYHNWRSSCCVFLSYLGDSGATWREAFAQEDYQSLHNARILLGNVKSMAWAIDHGLLDRFEDLVYGDAFQDLLEQADYLLERDYVLAAGVVLRAVLEERLKLLCDRHGCVPTTDRPTIESYKQELYKKTVLDKPAMKAVEAMAAVGNHCAHNVQPPSTKADVEGFRMNLANFVVRYSS